MSDLTLCRDTKCPNAANCYRAQAKPHPVNQAYYDPSPRRGDDCMYYAPMEYTDGTSAVRQS
jgi:hypothetical protein